MTGAVQTPKGGPAGATGDVPAKNLWSKIVAIGKERNISYREATEIAVREYWLEHKLDKKP